MSITDSRGFIKSFQGVRKQDILILFVITLSAVGGFALGKLSSISDDSFFIEQQLRASGGSNVVAATAEALGSREAGAVDTSVNNFPVPSGIGSVVGSKSGTKYHYPWCAGARSIKEENKIWFTSTEEARKAGYTPASNCKGLE